MKLRSLIYQSVLWRGIYFASVLLLNIMIARYYEASYSGLIYFVTNSFALIVTIASLSMESGVAYYTASGEVSTSRLANFSLWWTVMATVLLFIGYKVCIGLRLVPESYNNQVFSAICYVCGCMLVNFFAATFYSKRNFALPNILLALVNIMLVALIPFSKGILFTPQTYIYIYFLGFLLQGILVALLFYRQHGKPALFKLPVKKDMLKIIRYGMMAFLGNFLFFLVYRIDYWFVEAYCPTASLGNYIQVSKLIQTFLILPSMISTAVFPSVINNAEGRINEKIATISRGLLLIYIIICLALVISGYWLFPSVFGQTFTEMYIPFLCSIPGILALAMLHPVTAYYAGVKKMDINVKALLLALIVIIIGNIMVTPGYGITGAAIVSSIGYIVYHIYTVSNFRSYNAISYSRFYKITFADIQHVKQIIVTAIKRYGYGK